MTGMLGDRKAGRLDAVTGIPEGVQTEPAELSVGIERSPAYGALPIGNILMGAHCNDPNRNAWDVAIASRLFNRVSPTPGHV